MAVVGNAKNARLKITIDEVSGEGKPIAAYARGGAYRCYIGHYRDYVEGWLYRGNTELAFFEDEDWDFSTVFTFEIIDNQLALKNYDGNILISAIDNTHLVAGDWGITEGTLVSFENLDTASHTLTYDANGGTGTIAPETGFEFVLASSGFTKEGYNLTGWNTQADGSGTSYALGQSVTLSANMTLYAVWEVVVVKVRNLYAKGQQVTSLYHNGQEVNALYHNGVLVFEK